MPIDELQPRPWARYWARYFDTALFGTTSALGVYLVSPLVVPDYAALALTWVLWGMLALFCWIFIEAACLAAWGRTPGKWLMNIRVTRASGGPIAFRQALKRSFQVWWRGMGIGLPLVAPIANFAAHFRLTKKSITRWDEEGGYQVRHGDIGFLRASGLALFLAGVFSLHAFRLAKPAWFNGPVLAKSFRKMAADYNKTLPQSVDDDTDVIATSFKDNVFRYELRLKNKTADEVDADTGAAKLRQLLTERACAQAELRGTFLKNGVTLRYSYTDKLGRPVTEIDIRESDCATDQAEGL